MSCNSPEETDASDLCHQHKPSLFLVWGQKLGHTVTPHFLYSHWTQHQTNSHNHLPSRALVLQSQHINSCFQGNGRIKCLTEEAEHVFPVLEHAQLAALWTHIWTLEAGRAIGGCSVFQSYLVRLFAWAGTLLRLHGCQHDLSELQIGLDNLLCSQWKGNISSWLSLLTKQHKTQLHHPLVLPMKVLVLLTMGRATQLVMTPPGSKLNGSLVTSCQSWRGHHEPDFLLLAQPLQAESPGKSVRTFPRWREDALLQVRKVFPIDEQEDLLQW